MLASIKGLTMRWWNHETLSALEDVESIPRFTSLRGPSGPFSERPVLWSPEKTHPMRTRPKAGSGFKTEKSAQRGSFRAGHPGVIHADIPAQNFGQGAQNPGKNEHLGAESPWAEGVDVHDPKGFPKTSVRNRGPKKHINFCNINFLAPTQKHPHFGPPAKKSLCASFLGKNAKMGPT